VRRKTEPGVRRKTEPGVRRKTELGVRRKTEPGFLRRRCFFGTIKDMHTEDYQTALPVYREHPFAEYYDPCRVGFFDIETTGLSAERHRLILAGLVLPPENDDPEAVYTARQYFAERPQEEGELLAALLPDLAALDAVVTYNGRRFDLPFLEARAAAAGLSRRVRLPADFDLCLLVRHYSELRHFLPDLRQKTLEDFLGLATDRDDCIDGGESVRLYGQWLRSGEEELRHTVLLHNRDDILQMVRLMQVVEKTDLHRAMAGSGFPCGNWQISRVHLTTHRLHVHGLQFRGAGRHDEAVDYEYSGDGILDYHLRREDGRFEIRAAVHEQDGVTFADLGELRLDPAAYRSRYGSDPAQHDELLVLRLARSSRSAAVDYRSVNRLARLLTERIQQWITEN
jgi:uncharacterized protein YprB with RNaseH-like and TPR domain